MKSGGAPARRGRADSSIVLLEGFNEIHLVFTLFCFAVTTPRCIRDACAHARPLLLYCGVDAVYER